MASDNGSQLVTLAYKSPDASAMVNRRLYKVVPTGIYEGGYIKVTGGSGPYNVTVSPLVCEIADSTAETDGTQVRVQTRAESDSLSVAVGRYVVLRWTYTGNEGDDYMEILAVATPDDNDLVVGKIITDGAISYDDDADGKYGRSNPNVQALFLKPEPTDTTAEASDALKVRVRAGWIQTATGWVYVKDQKTVAITPPAGAGQSRTDLVYIDSTGTVQVQTNTSATTTPLDYAGKFVVAEVTTTNGDSAIVASQIKDVRSLVSNGSVLPYTGQQSITWPNGLIEKSGYVARSGTDTTVTFTAAFSNAVVYANVTPVMSAGTATDYATTIKSVSISNIVITNALAVDGYYWCVRGY